MTSSPSPLPTIPQIALAAFLSRRDRARNRIRDGRVAPDAADRHLRPWVAIALLCGADPAAVHPDLPGLLEQRRSRWLLADDICPRARWAPLLAETRDRAIDRHEAHRAARRTGPEAAAAFEEALGLARLCRHLAHDINARPGAGHPIPEYRPQEARKAA